MDSASLNAAVAAYLNGTGACPVWDEICAEDARTHFCLRTAKRLVHSYDLYRAGRCGSDDFMIALRAYLLILQVKMLLPDVALTEGNPYGLLRDAAGLCSAVEHFPAALVHSFVAAVFAGEDPLRTPHRHGTNLMTDAFIRHVTGFSQFKSLAQKLAVYGALCTPDGDTTLISLPTGGGKSLVTQTLAYQREGLTIVIVPTVSLAIDQVRTAKRILRSACVDEEVFAYHSGVDPAPIYAAMRERRARMLFISPEALINNEGFAEAVEEANRARYLRTIVVDEAHIVIDWGALFRIDYQCLEAWRKKLMRSNPAIRTILLSATFEERAVDLLKDFFTQDGARWIEIRCDALRHEPRYAFVRAASYSDKMAKLLELVRTLPHPMIVYVASPADAEAAAQHLCTHGIANVRTFTGLTTGVQRKKLIDAWTADEFPIMVATSAFGVGVDKSDVRTVLHLYLPQNANAYYQELGRGGRDGLPCLSIMLCVLPDDLSAAFGRISKKVMTTEKILGRWNSMYHSPLSLRKKQLCYMDTSIRPNYAETDSMEDVPPSEADVNWNVYVLLFLRRYHLIRIHEVLPQGVKYIFVIEVLEEALRSPDEEQRAVVERCRAAEWDYYVSSYQSMRTAIKNCGTVCWSEMFYEIYDRVSAFCGGCNAHTEPHEGDFLDAALKMQLPEPVKLLTEDQLALFAGAASLIVPAYAEDMEGLMAALAAYRLAVFISDDAAEMERIVEKMQPAGNLLLLSSKDLRALIAKKAYYYLSGLIAVRYTGTPKEVFALFTYVTRQLGQRTRLIHIPQENTYFDGQGKSFTDLVDSAVLPPSALVR